MQVSELTDITAELNKNNFKDTKLSKSDILFIECNQ